MWSELKCCGDTIILWRSDCISSVIRYISWKKSTWGGWKKMIQIFQNYYTNNDYSIISFYYIIDKIDITCKMSRQDSTFSCLKNIIILSSRKTRFELTKLWNTFGSFFNATLFPSRGSVTDHTTPNAPYPIGLSGW